MPKKEILGTCLGGFPRECLNYAKCLNLNPVVEGYKPLFYLLTQLGNLANQLNLVVGTRKEHHSGQEQSR
jgi:hypothetical protein